MATNVIPQAQSLLFSSFNEFLMLSTRELAVKHRLDVYVLMDVACATRQAQLTEREAGVRSTALPPTEDTDLLRYLKREVRDDDVAEELDRIWLAYLKVKR
jgi:hypothetical protein